MTLWENIQPTDGTSADAVRRRWHQIAKPLNSLGVFEEQVVKLGGIFGSQIPHLKGALAVFCGDHGVVAEGISQTGSHVTRLVAENFERNRTCASIMAKSAGIHLYPVDVGMDCPDYGGMNLVPNQIAHRKVGRGTKNIVLEDAMTRAECEKALKIGMDTAGELKEKGYTLLITGEMGIGNTTPAAAVAAVLLKEDARNVTDKGAGLSDMGLELKIKTVERAVMRWETIGDKSPVGVIQALGGFEIAAMTGFFLGGALHKLPVVVDGFIASVAALVAVNLCPNVRDYLLASHQSSHKGSTALLDALGLTPVIHGNLCVGEGTGGIMLVPLLQMALDIFNNMCTFDETAIESYKEL